MTRSILHRFALFNAVAFAVAICVSLAVGNWHSSNEITESYCYVASMVTEETQAIFDNLSYDQLFGADSNVAYERVRKALRELSVTFQAEYLYVYEADVSSGTRTYLFCVAQDDREDQVVRSQRGLGAQSSVPLSQLEVQAANGTPSDVAEITHNEYGYDLCWYFPLTIDGATKPIVFGADFDAEEEQQEIWEYTLAFAVPLLVGIAIIAAVEIVMLKKSVSDPLRLLSRRMRSFVQDGAHSQEHVVSSKTKEIVEIQGSFEQMTDDIDDYVGRIAQMCEERVAADTELGVARRIQLGLVPPTTQCVGDGFDAYAFERAARAVGGDFYDLTALDDGKLLLVIADVSGKGVSAALFMAMFLTLLHNKLQSDLDPARALNEANDLVMHNNPENMFVTLVAGIYDPATRVLTYANAGHTPPLMVGGTFLNPDPGIALGLFEDAGIVNETLVLRPGEGVLLYTDGTTEAVNPHSEFFGEERLMEAVKDARDAQSAVQAAVDAVDAFAGEREQFDDVTLLALFATGEDEADWQATLEPELSSFQTVREHVVELCGATPEAKQAILACDEAFANVVYYSGATAVEVAICKADDTLVVRIADDGTPFDPLSHNAEEREFEDMDMGGMGIMLMRETSKDAAYERQDNKNVLTLTFGL